MKKPFRLLLYFGCTCVLLASTACGGAAGTEPTFAPQPTYTPQPTFTPAPTFTSVPTQPPIDTATPIAEPEIVAADSVAPTPQIRTDIRGTIASEANVRTGPGLTFEILAPAVPGGIPAFAQGRDSFGEWVLIATPTGIIGWVTASRLSFDVPVTTIPVLNSTELPTPQAPAAALTPLAAQPDLVDPGQLSAPVTPSSDDVVADEDEANNVVVAGNLLANGGFEEPYYRIATEEGGGAIAEGWEAWWFNDVGDDYSVPEFEIAPDFRDEFRIHSGLASQQIFRPATLWLAGVYQTVEVPAGEQLRFTAYGHAWSTFCVRQNDEDICDPRDSNYGQSGNPMYMKIGIDPTGGTDGLADSIVWSEELIAWDNFVQFSVEAVAQNSSVTVFTWSTPEFPATVNNVYWDEAELVIIP